jgi:glycosyl transferase family 2
VTPPALSVVVVAYYGYPPMRQLMRHLSAQTLRHQIEMVVVASSADALALDDGAFAGFWGFQIVEVGRITALNRARVAGIRAARGRIVALTEDHCFPRPDWAEALLRAHDGPWIGVGPTIGLANPQRHRAWANYLLQYGPWVAPTRSGEISDIPGHNSSYKREALLAFGEHLDAFFMADTILHWELGRRGHRLYLESGARAEHVYMTRLRPFIAENYCIGRQFASTRARPWSAARRLAFAMATPLIPLVRFTRILGRMREFGWLGRLLPILPSLALGLTVSAAGEFMGCLFGIGRAAERTLDLDFCRDRFVSDQERAAIWGDSLLVSTPAPPAARAI